MSNSTHYLIMSGYIFLEKHYTNYVCNILTDNLEQDEFKSQGVVIC